MPPALPAVGPVGAPSGRACDLDGVLGTPLRNVG